MIHGHTAPGFEPVRDAFLANFTEGVEVGASFCAILDGDTVVDLWGGHLDQARSRPWRQHSLVNVYSTIKGPAAAAVAVLVEEGKLDYQAPVRELWPELRAAGNGLTVSGLLSHQAGLCGLREPVTVADLYDWDGMCRRLEDEMPFWEPGTAAGYHAVTWGFLVGELVRRASGETLAQVLRSRLAEPLAAELWIGAPEQLWPEVADLIGPNRASRPPPSAESHLEPPPLNKVAMENPVIRPYGDACSGEWRRAELAASNGHGNARGIARVYAALARGGELGGVRVLNADTVHELSRQVWGEEPDLVLGYPMRRGRGVNLNTRGELGPNRTAFGHTGTGGSLGFADPERRLGAGYAMNQLWGGTGPGSRSGQLLDVLYACL